MSGGLAPSKSTVYASNLPFSLTNNDIHKIFEKYGQVVKVTILKDRDRKSKGVAFVLYLDRDAAHRAVRALNNTQMFGRNLKCSIAKDNGRASDFIRRRDYPDKSKCYECGEPGHLSYNCPKNLLGEREPPKKKEKKKKRKAEDNEEWDEEEDEDDAVPSLKEDSLSAAIKFQQEKMEAEYQYRLSVGASLGGSGETKKKKYKKDAYFSDEEELSD
ncbi:zinc finger CCHC-type and RNA-binding motif-containing protein 1 [Lingula anatina]|uniref:Zinc finger CCHC-type and RNA-binding motif-containing protein 1 n=1 Tax=Lingula anatina TaxID=7574 RepID=A0A1S3IU65_LINAN|nr:zinc finger CCHC-type and RNA-binding motif-containing protein 1 [Lingula anatina]|eukprot:XP_013401747.1 zinc finger CCHC-type and RNA-binding motif-containing protein 1 [Lingula anatina]